jgi:hypothetical protein
MPESAGTTRPPDAPDEGEPWAISFDPGPGFDRPGDLLVDASGVYVAGTRGADSAWLVHKRAHDDGALIFEATSPGTAHGPRALARTDAALFVAGDGRVEKRSLRDGSLVAAFGRDGRVEVPDHVIHDLVVAGDHLFLVGASYVRPGPGLWVQKRSAHDGRLVTAFGEGGEVLTAGGDRSNYWLAGALHGGTLYVAGFQSTRGSGRIDAIDARRGAPVRAFGDGGTVVVGSLRGGVQDVATSGDALYLLGVADGAWLMERRGRDGALRWSRRFEVGRLWGAPSGDGGAACVAADPRGVVFGGSRGGRAWVLRASDPDGARVRHYVRDPTAGRDELVGVALTDGFVYAFGFESTGERDVRWRLERIARGSEEPPPSASAPAASPDAPPDVDPRRAACEARPGCRWVPDSPCLGRGARCLEEEIPDEPPGYTCHCPPVDSRGAPVLPQ